MPRYREAYETAGGWPEAARSVAAPKQQPARSPDTVLHHSETTGGHV
ncbi:MAG: hypothetical protein LBD24_08855 [Spirochaetaceae bacterium]|nr:hypothetical protein [Spirochaetaceae bacterium]